METWLYTTGGHLLNIQIHSHLPRYRSASLSKSQCQATVWVILCYNKNVLILPFYCHPEFLCLTICVGAISQSAGWQLVTIRWQEVHHSVTPKNSGTLWKTHFFAAYVKI